MIGEAGSVDTVSFSSDGRTVVSCGDGAVRFWSVDHLREYGIFQRDANDASISADGERLYLTNGWLMTFPAPDIGRDRSSAPSVKVEE